MLTAYGAGTNHACVDDTYNNANNDTDYVYTTSSTSISDIYGLPNHTTESGTINYVQVVCNSRSTGYAQHPTGTFKVKVADSSATSASANHAPITTSYAKYYGVFTSKPSDSEAWDWNAIDTMEIGLACSSPSITITEAEEIIRPTGAGSHTECIPIGDTNGWECVDETGAHDEDVTYIKTASGLHGGQDWSEDSYAMGNTISSGTINSVKLVYVGRSSPTYPSNWGKVRPFLRMYGTDYTGGNFIDMTTTWTSYSYTWTSQPSDSSAWNWDAVDALEGGVRLWDDGWNYQNTNVTQVYIVITYQTAIYNNPEIRTTQCYAIVNYTPASNVVTLNTPTTLSMSHSRKIQRTTFPGGSYEVDDYGRAGKTLVVSGTETSSASANMQTLKDMCHYGEEVAVTGLPDSNLNTDYMIKDFSWGEEAGHVDRVYKWNITLEEA